MLFFEMITKVLIEIVMQLIIMLRMLEWNWI